MATAEMNRPATLAGVREEQIVDLDVRPILREGGEPFSLIMETVGGVPPAASSASGPPSSPRPSSA